MFGWQTTPHLALRKPLYGVYYHNMATKLGQGAERGSKSAGRFAGHQAAKGIALESLSAASMTAETIVVRRSPESRLSGHGTLIVATTAPR